MDPLPAPGPPAPPLRSLLFVAYHYPPMRSAGVERSAKFVRYLPEFGYAPTVLGTSAFGRAADDGAVLRAWEPVGLYRRLLNPAARRAPAAASRTRTRGPQAGLLGRLRRTLLVPDGQVTWLPGAALSALRHLRRRGASLIFTTSPPVSAHLLGRFLREQTGLPWVADLRDAWLYDPLDPQLLAGPWRRELERRLEEGVIEAADAVVAATETTAADLRARYPSAAHKVRVVTNGFDPEDGEAQPEGLVVDAFRREGAAAAAVELADEPPRATRPVRLVHTGSFSYSHPLRRPDALLRALSRLVDVEPIWVERLELTLVGELSPEEQAAAAPLAAAGVVCVVGAVDRATALGYQRRADVLLVVDHRRPWPASNAPGKLYEYLATRKPLLALCGPGEVEQTVLRLGAGLCALADDVDAIEAALRAVWQGLVDGTLPHVRGSLEPYHRRELTRQLAACFDEVLAS